jgi:hypothetical protein
MRELGWRGGRVKPTTTLLVLFVLLLTRILAPPTNRTPSESRSSTPAREQVLADFANARGGVRGPLPRMVEPVSRPAPGLPLSHRD